MKTNTLPRKGFDLRILVLAGVAAACLHPALTHAAAAPDADPIKKSVTYGDLNLASPQGVERLYRRIVGAAHEVCETSGDRSLVTRIVAATCTREAINHAVTAINRPALTALHAQKTGQFVPARRLAQQ